MILKKTFENNYSNGRLPVESRNPATEHSSGCLAARPFQISKGRKARPTFETLKRLNRAAVCHSCCLLKGERGGGGAFSDCEAERRDLPPLLEVVIHGIFENVKGTAPLSPRKTLGRRWQALSAETQALTRRESKVIHLTAQGWAQKSAF